MNIPVPQHEFASSEACVATDLMDTSGLRIAIISDAAPGRNGVGTYYVDLVVQLQPYVAEIQMVCPTVEGDKWRAGLVLPLPGDKTQKMCMPNPFTLRRRLAALKPHLMIIATPGAYGLLGAYMAGRMGVPAVAGFHTSFEQLTKLYWNNSAAGKVVHGYFRVSNYYLFKKCSLVLANSQAMIEQARDIGAPDTALVPTEISPVFIDCPVVPYSGELSRVLFAGRLAPEKNIETLYQAAKSLPHIQFTLAGDGPERARVEQWAAELPNLTCLGWLSREALRDEIDRHHMLVLPSHFESFGTIALEAMARRRLVVVSAQCGIAEWHCLREGLSVMEDESLSDAISAMERMNRAERQCRARKAFEKSRELNHRNLQKWFGLFKRILSAEKHRAD